MAKCKTCNDKGRYIVGHGYSGGGYTTKEVDCRDCSPTGSKWEISYYTVDQDFNPVGRLKEIVIYYSLSKWLSENNNKVRLVRARQEGKKVK